MEGSDAALASVLESLDFCLKLRGSEASVLEDLAKAINLVHVRQDLVESSHTLLNHAYRALQEYERCTYLLMFEATFRLFASSFTSHPMLLEACPRVLVSAF